MNLLKTGFLTAIATFARLLSAFLVMKLVAVLAGPEGVAQLGQFMSLTALLVVFAGGGVGSGVVKYLAQFRDDVQSIQALVGSALTFTLVSSLLMCVLVLIFSADISIWLLGGEEYTSLIVVLAVAQIFVALHNLIIAIINGMMDVKRLALVHVIGAVIGVLLPSVLGYFFKLYGVLLAFVLGQGMLLFVSLGCYARSQYFNLNYFRPSVDNEMLSRLAKFSLMTLTSALLAPIVQIVVRNMLAESFSWEQVGYWQAVTKVSEAYLLFISMAISVYYLPKLSSIDDRQNFKREIVLGYTILMPVVFLSAAFVFILKGPITWLLFSDEFEGALYLYAPQLIGDVIKIASFLLSYIMLAKSMTKTFFLSELFFSSLYVVLVYVMSASFGLIGAMYAFIVNYFIYFIFTLIVAKIYIKGMP
ncbi:lipopolysaccharide biosynthesis protein [Pseudomonas sp. 250J]|uniref:O-antigen translocase n=1 Tax=Pseudomonas TaxID=286 RepID=UPI00067FCE20|nr:MULTISPECIES: O-antigen translocase [Pseudomonas]KNX75741.1 lipopolysaccharide biosynthesis protein [Pseudomonas sp. 250J]MCU7280499.1 O-antigen translocase [Pseudomonas peradeniyensis]QZA54463.1 O-antigen translocase [Pseudomonas sp. 2hn]